MKFDKTKKKKFHIKRKEVRLKIRNNKEQPCEMFVPISNIFILSDKAYGTVMLNSSENVGKVRLFQILLLQGKLPNLNGKYPLLLKLRTFQNKLIQV